MSAGLLNLAAVTNDAERMAEIGEASNRKRKAISRVRQDLMDRGRPALIDVITRRPTCVRHYRLWELIDWTRYLGGARLAGLNHLAISEGVNLAVKLGEADPDTLRWVERTVGGKMPSLKTVKRELPQRKTVAILRAVEDHRRDVRDDSSPAEAFALADDRLYERCREIMRGAA